MTWGSRSSGKPAYIPAINSLSNFASGVFDASHGSVSLRAGGLLARHGSRGQRCNNLAGSSYICTKRLNSGPYSGALALSECSRRCLSSAVSPDQFVIDSI